MILLANRPDIIAPLQIARYRPLPPRRFKLGDISLRRIGSAVLCINSLCSFARRAMTRKCEDQQWRRECFGEAKAEQDDEAMDNLLKPSPLFVAGLTLCVAFARATAVAKIRIKQFLAIPLAGEVVAPCPVMAMPLFLLHRGVESRSRTHGAAGRIASGSDRYRHEDVSRMAGRTHEE
jgi:hypothetical protein